MRVRSVALDCWLEDCTDIWICQPFCPRSRGTGWTGQCHRRTNGTESRKVGSWINGVQSPIAIAWVLEKPQEENVHLRYEDHHMAYNRKRKIFEKFFWLEGEQNIDWRVAKQRGLRLYTTKEGPGRDYEDLCQHHFNKKGKWRWEKKIVSAKKGCPQPCPKTSWTH